MKQQTAVDWLFNHIPLEWTIKGSAKKIFEQAKQMEKEQIIQAFEIACQDQDRIGNEYYNETYGQ